LVICSAIYNQALPSLRQHRPQIPQFSQPTPPKTLRRPLQIAQILISQPTPPLRRPTATAPNPPSLLHHPAATAASRGLPAEGPMSPKKRGRKPAKRPRRGNQFQGEMSFLHLVFRVHSLPARVICGWGQVAALPAPVLWDRACSGEQCSPLNLMPICLSARCAAPLPALGLLHFYVSM
jgi:hypothetical protein